MPNYSTQQEIAEAVVRMNANLGREGVFVSEAKNHYLDYEVLTREKAPVEGKGGAAFSLDACGYEQLDEVKITVAPALTSLENGKTVFSEICELDPYWLASTESTQLIASMNVVNNLMSAVELYSLLHKLKNLNLDADLSPLVESIGEHVFDEAKTPSSAEQKNNFYFFGRVETLEEKQANRNKAFIDYLNAMLNAVTDPTYITIMAAERITNDILSASDNALFNVFKQTPAFAKLIFTLQLKWLESEANQNVIGIEKLCQAAVLCSNTNSSNELIELNQSLASTMRAMHDKTPQATDNLLNHSKRAQDHPSRRLQALGVAMGVLGVGLIVVGALLLFSSLFPLPSSPLTFGLGIGAMALGSLCLGGGSLLFFKKRQKGVSLAMEEVGQGLRLRGAG